MIAALLSTLEFNDACQKTPAAAATGLPFAQHQADAVEAFEMLRLVASPMVAAKATAVHGSMGAITQAPPPNRPMLLASYNAQMVALMTAIRTEIGVDAN